MGERSISFDIAAIDKASKALESVGREVVELERKIDGASGTIEVNADTAKAVAELRKVDSQLARLNAKSFKIDADISAAERDLKVLDAELKRATGDKRIKVDADIEQVRARLRALQAEKVSIDVDTAAASARVRQLDAQLRGISGSKSKVDVDAAGAFSKLAQLGAELRNVKGPITIAISVVGISGAINTIARLGAGLSSIGALAVTAGGVAKASFSGIGDALSAMGEKATSGGGAVEASASSIRSATRQVEAAQRDLRDAHREVEAAERDLVSTNEEVKRSEEDLSLAQEDARRAVEALDDARKAATRTLEDYQTRTESMSLSLESASLSIAEAQARLNEVNDDSKSTSLERARAELNVREAIQRRNEMEIDAKRLTEDKTEADRKGVEQSDEVVGAQDRIKDANRRVQDAQRGLAESQQAVRDAQQKLAESHEKVTLAVQRISDAQLELREAMKPQGGGGTSVDKLKEAMKNLTPEGQRFVVFLRGLIDGPLKQLQDTAQSKFLPGLQAGIQGFMANLGTAKQSIATVATNMGNFFRDIGPAAGRAAEAFLRLAAAGSGPGFRSLADVVNKALDGFTKWANSQDSAKISEDIRKIGEGLGKLKDAMVLAIQVADALWPALKWPADNLLIPMIERFVGLIEKIPGVGGKFAELGTSMEQATGPAGNLAQAQRDLATATQSAADKVREQQGLFLGSEQASLRYGEALLRANEAIKTNGAVFGGSTAAGLANKDAVLGLVDAANRNIEAMARQGASTPQLNAAYASQREALIRVMTQMGVSKTAAQQYIDKLLETPVARETKVTADTETARENLRLTHQAVTTLPDKTVNIRGNTSGISSAVESAKRMLSSIVDKTVNIIANHIGFSRGGWVPGSPSGVDSVDARLAPGEFVVRSSAAGRWAPLLEQINSGAVPAGAVRGATGGGASSRGIALSGGGGGSSGAPIVVNVSNAVVGNSDELSRVVVTAIREAKARGLLVGAGI